MAQERLQILISAVNANARSLPMSMGIESDAVIVNQIIPDDGSDDSNSKSGVIKEDKGSFAENRVAFCENAAAAHGNEVEEFEYNGHGVRILTRNEKGVGLSRNTALEASDHEIIHKK